jgi:hypothetical protein
MLMRHKPEIHIDAIYAPYNQTPSRVLPVRVAPALSNEAVFSFENSGKAVTILSECI